jgi:hypothetical protein
MREVAQLAEILAAKAQMHHDLIAFSTPAFMPSTGTPRKKHVNKLHCSRKAKKKTPQKCQK